MVGDCQNFEFDIDITKSLFSSNLKEKKLHKQIVNFSS